jgi:aminoglycoside phosphotransferase family enzyme/gluconate kinase
VQADTSGNDRRELMRSLIQADAYPHPVDRIEHLQTHISDVLLTGPYAYKLKKPLDLGFLDFSTLDKRRHYCEEELRLNRRLAPDLYLAVLPITGEPARPRLGGEGPILEYALQMRQFDQSGLLDRVVAKGKLADRHLDQLAERVARFHGQLPPAPEQSDYGTPAAIMAPARQNFDQLRPLLDDEQDRERLDRVQRWTEGQHGRLAATFERRRQDGFVRECHGDLHLANMVLIDDQVRIFDCIEFNPALRWIDVTNEVAFVAMDLIQRGHGKFAYRFLDRYWQLTGDYGGVPLLRYYMVYRALVRAKVAAMRAQQEDVPDPTRQTLAQRTRAHIELAAELSSAPPPVLIIMHGLSGSGKTRLSQLLLEQIGAIRVRSDVERKRLHSLPATARTDSALAAGVYGAAASAATYERLREVAHSILSGGITAIVDAAFLRREQRDRFRTLARESGVQFAVAHAEASEATLRQRVAQRAATELDASEATVEVLDHQLKTQEPLSADEQTRVFVFETERGDESALSVQGAYMLQRIRAPESRKR